MASSDWWWIDGVAAALLVAVAARILRVAFQGDQPDAGRAFGVWRAPVMFAAASGVLAGMEPMLTLLVGGLLLVPWSIGLEKRRKSLGSKSERRPEQPDWLLAIWIWTCTCVGIALAAWDKSATPRDVAAVLVLGSCSGLVCAYARATNWAMAGTSTPTRNAVTLGLAYLLLILLLPIATFANTPVVAAGGCICGGLFAVASRWTIRRALEAPTGDVELRGAR